MDNDHKNEAATILSKIAYGENLDEDDFRYAGYLAGILAREAEGCNGWSNWATWAIGLHLEFDDEDARTMADEFDSRAGDNLRERVEERAEFEIAEGISNGVGAELIRIALDAINWTEHGRHINEQAAEAEIEEMTGA